MHKALIALALLALPLDCDAQTTPDSVTHIPVSRKVDSVTVYYTKKQPAPTPTPAPVVTTCSGVNVVGPASIQSAVNANGQGTTFCLTGVFAKQTVTVKARDKFIGLADSAGVKLAFMDGQHATTYAFMGGDSTVVIQGLKVCGYTPPISDGAIRGYGGKNWQVLNNQVCDNKPGAGIEIATGRLVRGNNVHHNGQLGITCQAGSNGAIADTNDIHDNNVGRVFDPNNAAGGLKCVRATNLTLRGNHAHNNDGSGLWCDNCDGPINYLGNTVEGNTFIGIYHEVSGSAVIQDNILTGNGTANRGDIWVDNSAGVQIRHNTVAGPSPAGLINLRELSRPDLPNRHLSNVQVTDNTVSLGGGFVAMVTAPGTGFVGNHYTGGTGLSFRLNGTLISWSQWQAAGQDMAGSFLP